MIVMKNYYYFKFFVQLSKDYQMIHKQNREFL